MRGGAVRRFKPSPFDVGPQYGGALSIPAVAKMLPTVLASAAPSKKNLKRAAMAGLREAGRSAVKTVKRGLKRKAQGLANRVVDRAAGVLAKRAKGGVADLLGV